jgi:hypothetical protein
MGAKRHDWEKPFLNLLLEVYAGGSTPSSGGFKGKAQQKGVLPEVQKRSCETPVTADFFNLRNSEHLEDDQRP